jgi:hypothetical protein
VLQGSTNLSCHDGWRALAASASAGSMPHMAHATGWRQVLVAVQPHVVQGMC